MAEKTVEKIPYLSTLSEQVEKSLVNWTQISSSANALFLVMMKAYQGWDWKATSFVDSILPIYALFRYYYQWSDE